MSMFFRNRAEKKSNPSTTTISTINKGQESLFVDSDEALSESEGENENCPPQSTTSYDLHPDELPVEVDSEEHQDEIQDLSSEEYDFRTRMLAGQWDRENQARCSTGFLVKNQRVRYFHKASGYRCEGHVAAVHFDDGPDRPYYTIQYIAPDTNDFVEKQTTHDRLEAASWDGDKTWEILQARMGGGMVV